MTIAFMGIDLAKNVFQLHGVDDEGNAVFKKRLRREALLGELADIPACRIGIEACTGAFWWRRQFEALGHTVKVIAPQYVKPFLKHQKNDRAIVAVANKNARIIWAMLRKNEKFRAQA